VVTFSCPGPVLFTPEWLCCALYIERTPAPTLVAGMIIEVIEGKKNNSFNKLK